MPSLRELQGQLLRCQEETSAERDAKGMYVFRDKPSRKGRKGSILMWSPNPTRMTFVHTDRVADAHGVRFLCPKSFAKNGGPKGTHSVYVFFTGSPYAGHNTAGQEVRWQVSGNTLEDLCLSPSILEQDEGAPPEHRCGWHGFVGSSGVPPGHAA